MTTPLPAHKSARNGLSAALSLLRSTANQAVCMRSIIGTHFVTLSSFFLPAWELKFDNTNLQMRIEINLTEILYSAEGPAMSTFYD